MYNGPSGPRISLTMTFSSAHTAVAANIAPTAKQIILLALILIPFRLAAARRNIYSARRPMGNAPIGFASGCGVLFIRSSST